MRLGRTWIIVTALVVAAAATAVWWTTRAPPGVVAKGESETVAWLALATAVVSLLTGVVGLLDKLLARRAAPRE